MANRSRAWGAGCALLAAAMLAGCHMGPVSLRSDRTLYNEAVMETANRQLLLNIVRLKYREPTCFLELNGINASYSFPVGGQFTAQHAAEHLTKAVGTQTGFSQGTITGTYSEAPTFSYAPLQGEQFAKRVVGPIDTKTLGLLLGGGWPIDTVMRAMVERIEDLRNEPRMPSPVQEMGSRYDRFFKLVTLWRQVQKRGDLRVTSKTEQEIIFRGVPKEKVEAAAVILASQQGLRYRLAADGTYELRKPGKETVILELNYTEKEAETARRLLGARAGQDGNGQAKLRTKVRLMTKAHDPDIAAADGEVLDLTIELRSFINTLFYIAQDMPVPDADYQRGLVKVSKNEAGQVIPRPRSLDTLLDVKWHTFAPHNPFISVLYRGHWFYIDDADVPSKDTFCMLSYLFALAAADVTAAAAPLVLSVGH